MKLSKTRYRYNGKRKKPKVTVKWGKKTLKKNRDYTVTYSRGRRKRGTQIRDNAYLQSHQEALKKLREYSRQ